MNCALFLLSLFRIMPLLVGQLRDTLGKFRAVTSLGRPQAVPFYEGLSLS